MTHILQSFALIILLTGTLSCSLNENDTSSSSSQESPTNQETIITGVVKNLEFGKDGYIATVNTLKDEIYYATVSIPNLGGPDNYQTFKQGDLVTLEGKVFHTGEEQRLIVSKIIRVEGESRDLLILAHSYQGITPGSNITEQEARIQKDQLKTGEGSFDIYQILDNDKTAVGYFFPDPNQATQVGNIVIDIPTAKTLRDIKVGDTFQELKKKLPNLSVNGSENEGRTYVHHNNLSYRLDVPNFTYEVDIASIPADTKVTEIVINRGAQTLSTLVTRYQEVETNELCWLANDSVELFSEPTRTSNNLGNFLKGETLNLLGNRMVTEGGTERLWLHVQFLGSVKAGYESQFADGRPMHEGGETKGWIDGGGLPLINCK